MATKKTNTAANETRTETLKAAAANVTANLRKGLGELADRTKQMQNLATRSFEEQLELGAEVQRGGFELFEKQLDVMQDLVSLTFKSQRSMLEMMKANGDAARKIALEGARELDQKVQAFSIH